MHFLWIGGSIQFQKFPYVQLFDINLDSFMVLLFSWRHSRLLLLHIASFFIQFLFFRGVFSVCSFLTLYLFFCSFSVLRLDIFNVLSLITFMRHPLIESPHLTILSSVSVSFVQIIQCCSNGKCYCWHSRAMVFQSIGWCWEGWTKRPRDACIAMHSLCLPHLLRLFLFYLLSS